MLEMSQCRSNVATERQVRGRIKGENLGWRIENIYIIHFQTRCNDVLAPIERLRNTAILREKKGAVRIAPHSVGCDAPAGKRSRCSRGYFRQKSAKDFGS